MRELQKIRTKIEFAKKRNVIEQANNSAKNKNILTAEIEKQKKEQEKKQMLDEKKMKVLGGVKVFSVFAVYALFAVAIIQFSLMIKKQFQAEKDKYKKYLQAYPPVDNGLKLEACDMAKKFVSEIAANSTDEGKENPAWSPNINEDDKGDLVVAVRYLDPSDVSFNSVERLTQNMLHVCGSNKGKKDAISLFLEAQQGSNKLYVTGVSIKQ